MRPAAASSTGLLRSAACLLALGLAVVPAAHAQRRGIAPIPIELDAYVGAAPEGILPEYTWVVAQRDRRYTLLVTRLFVRNSRTSAMQLNEAVRPYRVTFTLAGTREAVAALTTAPSGRALTLRGNVRMSGGARYLILDGARPLPTPAPES